jgi:NAD(P)-dependent dehydrogenase (short-subunit alcohol dehydrogenase family)
VGVVVKRLDSAVAVVTGGNRGIGLEVVRQLAELGATVVLGARDVDGGRRAAAGLDVPADRVMVRRLDVTSDADVAALSAELEDRYGRLDILVNNAAITYDTWQRGLTADLDVVRDVLETNLLGVWRVAAAMGELLRRSEHGRLVNVSSGAGQLAGMGDSAPAYSVSKTALNALTRILADDLRPDGVLVNAVCPGWVATDMGGPGGRPVADGAASVLWAVLLDDDGPTGGFFRDGQPLDW